MLIKVNKGKLLGVHWKLLCNVFNLKYLQENYVKNNVKNYEGI